MRDVLEEIMALQPNWTAKNTPQMQRRGHFTRNDGPEWLREQIASIAPLFPAAGRDLAAEGRDGTGQKTEVPWFRVYSESLSPKARFGFYLVYLFDFPGDSVYLSLNQGTTVWENGEFRQLPEDLLGRRVDWARLAIHDAGLSVSDYLDDIDLAARGPLGAGYERGNVYSLQYLRGRVPDEATIAGDLHELASRLAAVYVKQLRSDVPGDQPAEVSEAVE